MTDFFDSRDQVLDALRRELVGPDPKGAQVGCHDVLRLSSIKELYDPHTQAPSGEEIIKVEQPGARYGVGILYPLSDGVDELEQLGEIEALQATEDLDSIEIAPSLTRSLQSITGNPSLQGDDPVPDFDISSANALKPSSMAISFLARVADESKLVVLVTGGVYREKEVRYESPEGSGARQWWLRSSVSISADFHGSAIRTQSRKKLEGAVVPSGEGAQGLDIGIEIYVRPWKSEGEYLITACAINRTKGSSSNSQYCLFQSGLEVRIEQPDNQSCFLPYPDAFQMSGADLPLDEEEQSLALLYRNNLTYAVGHGCAANWQEGSPDGGIMTLRGESLPTFEAPSMTPDAVGPNGKVIKVSMAELSGANGTECSLAPLDRVISAYESWIEAKDIEANQIHERYKAAAQRHLDDCRSALGRMKHGLEYLRSDPAALTAFKLANEAVLIQQSRSSREVRELKVDRSARLGFDREAPTSSYPEVGSEKGYWRAFQIAFLLMALKSSVDGDDEDRERVELIWFPTGGGKTEAYLGLAAFTLFHRRLMDSEDAGTQILMRYTLRLLTAQQFQRACGLICAMEAIRREKRDGIQLGKEPFTIGIWVGMSTTPNSNEEACKKYSALLKNRSEGNPFVVTKCPWCSARIGPNKVKESGFKAKGYKKQDDTVVFHCSDPQCVFADKLPILVIDEEIYKVRPSFLIATADKFASLAWKSEARSLFGLDGDGKRKASPPGLIIQDELHLISGPLGSMYGLYEAVIEELCTSINQGLAVKPKIVCSTATIRKYQNQILALYGRPKVCLFPPPGIEDGDSFFAKFARDENTGQPLPGRRFVGVFASALFSMQTIQVRSLSPLLQVPIDLPEDKRDPWWTLLVFFNSLRELGTTLTLFQNDIPDYFGQIRKRRNNQFQDLRAVGRLEIAELTARLSSDEVPDAIEKLEKSFNAKGSVDVCLASNIIEVGVDIDRLSLLCIVGQPKTTAQYIQVSGRVGRRWWERPGLIVMLYGPNKPRDRSHFEKFRTYHERLYAQVEPTSVTPFSPPVIDRALHSAMVAYVRQCGGQGQIQSPSPIPLALLASFENLILRRVELVDAEEVDRVRNVLRQRFRQWEIWSRSEWESSSRQDGIGLIRKAGEYVEPGVADLSWAVGNSIRSVDSSCEVDISQLYLRTQQEEELS